MAIFFFFLLAILFIALLGFVWWMEDGLYNPKPIPETESEKFVRNLKMRISDAEFKFKREIGEL